MIKDKIKTRAQATAICNSLRVQGKVIGFTSGVFDLLHAGHVDYLEKAKALCQVLVVGINSDQSVKKYKGPDRPVNSEQYRLRVVAALESVDIVFLFDERRNRKNIELLRPDLYIKAGDYQEKSLTSRKITEKFGGEVQIIPVTEAVSTTGIIQSIKDGFKKGERWIDRENTVHREIVPEKKSVAVFLDRDGTINEQVPYLHDPEKFRLLPGSSEGIKMLQDKGFRIVVVSNQPGIGMGYFPEEDFYRVNREMLKQLSGKGIRIDRIFYCPHSKGEKCRCRKPELDLIRRAEHEMGIDLSHSYLIGDKTADIETGKRAGIRTILVSTGYGGKDGEYRVKPDMTADNLKDAAEKIINTRKNADCP
jgi:rfaE bifunctional protein nucleotidyltransferase chain/domain